MTSTPHTSPNGLTRSGRVEVRPATPRAPEPPAPIDSYLTHFQWRLVQDALLEATSAYWLHRADTFAAVGNEACDLIAENCRHHAQLLTDTGLDTEAHAAIALALLDHQAGII